METPADAGTLRAPIGKARRIHHISAHEPASTPEPFARNRAINTLHTWLLAAGSLLLLAVTAWAFGGAAGIVYAVVFGAVSMLVVRRISPQMVLAMYKARPVGGAEFPTGVAIVEELARRAGLPAVPELYVIPSKMLNAFAVGRRDDSAIAITDALVRKLSARELAGVLAHEISHIAHEDVRVMALADMVSRFTSLHVDCRPDCRWCSTFSASPAAMATQVPWLAVLVLLAAPTVGGLLQMALSRTREFDADLGAAMLTGDPDGLASALTKLRACARQAVGRADAAGRPHSRPVDPAHPSGDRRARGAADGAEGRSRRPGFRRSWRSGHDAASVADTEDSSVRQSRLFGLAWHSPRYSRCRGADGRSRPALRRIRGRVHGR